MKPQKIINQLHLIGEGKRSFDKDELKLLVSRVSAHVKMLERDNGRLRAKIRRKRIEVKK